MEREKLWSIIESLLFASERPLAVKDLRAHIEGAEDRDWRELMEALAERYAQERRGFLLVEVAGGWQFRTNPENAEWVRKLLAQKPVKLSRAALETLAVIAYRQPITRAEIEDVRGVDAGGVLKMLLDRRLIKILGKKEEIGRPSIYGTTKDFLEFFGLKDLTSMPTLRDFHELSDDSLAKMDDAGFGAVAPSTEGAASEGDANAAVESPAQDLEAEGEKLAAAARAHEARVDTGVDTNVDTGIDTSAAGVAVKQGAE